MEVLLVAVLSAVTVIAVTALSPKAGVAAPLVLLLIGVGVSFLPFVPAIEIDPEVILAGVLPALLYASAAAFPSMDFRRDFTAIGGMSVLLVIISAVVMGLVFSLVVPGLDLAAGIALGAIVSPTDAVATSIIKKLGAPRRVVVMLDGEGLINDATSLVLLRSAVAATAASVSLWDVLGDFLKAVLLAVIIGAVVGRLGLWARARVKQETLSTAISFVVPFAAYLPAEEVHASGIVAAVTAGLVTSVLSARHLRPQDRVAERANWHTIEVLLEGGVFLAIGLEVFDLVADLNASGGSLWFAVGMAALGAAGTLVLRGAFVLPLLRYLAHRQERGQRVRGTLASVNDRLDAKLALHEQGGGPISERPVSDVLDQTWPDGVDDRRRERERQRALRRARALKRRLGPDGSDDHESITVRIGGFQRRITRKIADIDYLAAAPLGPKEGVVLVWAGMRGVVTLAAAQTLPHDFPQRSLIVLVAFGVAAGSLVLQGGTLPWVVRRLGLAGVTSSRHEEGTSGLRDIVDQAASEMLTSPELCRPDGAPYAGSVVERVRAMVVREQHDHDEEEAVPEDIAKQFFQLRLAVIAAQREVLLDARAVGAYDSDLLSRKLELLDADQIAIEGRAHSLEG
ncbi:sodium:proton antiporter [Isoptericola sp. NEAU-Y5]|uniref:Sodium:proton antiporter n=1 Tax=Isoptericola luteus TaxID=2879484 RepID=A0ABS7ZHF3_9MICO|nr:sodium:proton antiporter [Isoptericola sp. NEAU-Y5]MCA5894464.1 sodium:proton antiporter [Isoptericola sp. NEAU-Y5]